jgi:hypothetical protein
MDKEHAWLAGSYRITCLLVCSRAAHKSEDTFCATHQEWCRSSEILIDLLAREGVQNGEYFQTCEQYEYREGRTTPTPD